MNTKNLGEVLTERLNKAVNEHECQHNWKGYVNGIGQTGRECRLCGKIKMTPSDCNEERIANDHNI